MMNTELTAALQALKDKGGPAKVAATKAEILLDYSERMTDCLTKGEFWRVEIIIEVTENRLKAAQSSGFPSGGVTHPAKSITPETVSESYRVRNLDVNNK